MFGIFSGSTAYPLDPFGLWPTARSSIAGLGGEEPSPQGDVAFHTLYTSFEPGPLTVDLQFTGLAATCGKMLLHAMALPIDGSPPQVQVTNVLTLAELAAAGGRHRLSLIVKRDCAYAIMGRSVDGSDARATGLALRTDQSADGPAFARKLAAAKDTLFAPRNDPDGLVIDGPATLAVPRSQMCTAAQFDEPDYDRWIGLMHRHKHQHRKQWEHVWICRTIEAAGLLAEGARGLGFGCGVEPLPAVFAAHGATVLATDLGASDRRARRWQQTSQHLLSVEALADPAICPPALFEERVSVAAVDMNAIPPSLTGYDFCWSSCSLEHLGTIEAGLAFIERSLETLRPGGVAAHTTELNLTSNSRTIRKGGTVLYRRRDIEQFARRMMAAGHEVTPITFDQGDQPVDQLVDVPPYADDIHFKLALGTYVATSFGLAVRKRT